jgi:hypothetical protein
MRWLLLNWREDVDPDADPSPHPLVVQPRTVIVPLLPLLVPLLSLLVALLLLVLLLNAVLSSAIGGVLEPRSV